MPGFPVQTTGTHKARKDPALRLNLKNQHANREIGDSGKDNGKSRSLD